MSTKFPIDPTITGTEEEFQELLGNEFMKFPAIFKTPDDIWDFIQERNLDLPVLKNLLKLRSENKIELTPTELDFVFKEIFDYVYDVYRVPVEKTYKATAEWLKYIENTLVYDGLEKYIQTAYASAIQTYETGLHLDEILKDLAPRRELIKEINYYKDIGLDDKEKSYYERNDTKVIESFWIKSSGNAGQPQCVGDEAYMRVNVYSDRVYIYGCDDCSYTLETKTEEEAVAFAKLLKCAAPVWNFGYNRTIHRNLEFTN